MSQCQQKHNKKYPTAFKKQCRNSDRARNFSNQYDIYKVAKDEKLFMETG